MAIFGNTWQYMAIFEVLNAIVFPGLFFTLFFLTFFPFIVVWGSGFGVWVLNWVFGVGLFI